MGRGGRVELEEGWRNRRRSRSGERPSEAKVQQVQQVQEPMEMLKSARSADRRAEEEEAAAREAEQGKEEAEALAEDFSDFGDSDEDILNQEEDHKEEGRVEEGASSRGASPRGRKRREGVLEGLGGGEEEKGEQEEVVASNARLADALGADWSLLMKPKGEKAREVVEGAARKRWSGASIFARIGLSQVTSNHFILFE